MFVVMLSGDVQGPWDVHVGVKCGDVTCYEECVLSVRVAADLGDEVVSVFDVRRV